MKHSKSITFRKQLTINPSPQKHNKFFTSEEAVGKGQQDKLSFLSSISLFSQMSQNRLRHKLNIFKEESYERGTIFFKENAPVDFCWLVISGEVQLSSMVQLDTLKEKIRVKLSICITKIIFGEGELIEENQQRVCRAEAITEVSCYKIQISEFQNLLMQSDLYDHLVNEYATKKKYWEARISYMGKTIINICGQEKKVTKEVDKLHSMYQKEVNIPKKYNNFIPANKIIWNKKIIDLDKELQQAQVDKQKEVQQLMNFQVKKQFKSNYIMRRLLIEAHKQKIHIEVMDGLDLSKYLNLQTNNVDRVDNLMQKYRLLQSKQELQDLMSDDFMKDKSKEDLVAFENSKLKDLRPHSKQFSIVTSITRNFHTRGNWTQLNSPQQPMRILSASTLQNNTILPFDDKIKRAETTHYEKQDSMMHRKIRRCGTAVKREMRPLTASTVSLKYTNNDTSRSRNNFKFVKDKQGGKNSSKFFQDLFNSRDY